MTTTAGNATTSRTTGDALPISTVLQGGAFTVDKVLGQGGFGITYLCRDAKLNRLVAIKEFYPMRCTRRDLSVVFPDDISEAEQESARRNFLSEARVLAQLHHANVVNVHSTFEENNTAYMVMRFLEGKTLEQLVEERGMLPETEAVGYIKQVGAAVETVHGANFIHRDIKPENVIVSTDGQAVLLDFGLNKELADAADYNTVRFTGAIRFGSPGYSPPEQYGRQARFGPYTDIYALGATLYFLLTGKVPPEAPDRMGGEELADVRELNPQVSREVCAAITWALQLKGDERPQTVQDFLTALEPNQAKVASSAASVAPQSQQVISPVPTPPKQPTPLQPAPIPAASTGASMTPAQNPVAPQAPVKSPVPFLSPGLAGQPPQQLAVKPNVAARCARHLASGFREILPRLILIAAILIALIVAARQQSRQPTRSPKSGGTTAAAKAKISKDVFVIGPVKIAGVGLNQRK